MSEEEKHKWWDLKPFGYLPPKEENRIIFYVLAGIIIMTVLYLATFYVR